MEIVLKKKAEKKAARIRSKKYVATRSQVDKTKIYDAFSAIELTKKLSYSKFDGSITVDGVVRETGVQNEACSQVGGNLGDCIRHRIKRDRVDHTEMEIHLSLGPDDSSCHDVAEFIR